MMMHAALWPSELLTIPGAAGAGPRRWHHVAFVYGGIAAVGPAPSAAAGRRVYVDGELVAARATSAVTLTSAQAAAVVSNAAGEGSLAIGKGARRGGAVDDLRVWSRALTPMEVGAVAASRAVATTGLLAHWTFDDDAAPLTAMAGVYTLTPRGTGTGSTSASLETSSPHTPTVRNPPAVVAAAAAGSSLHAHSSSAGYALRFGGAGRAAGFIPAPAVAVAASEGVCVSLRFRTFSTGTVGGMPLASIFGGGNLPIALKWTRAGGLTAIARGSSPAVDSPAPAAALPTIVAAAPSHRLLNDGAWHHAAACLVADPAVESALQLRLTLDGVDYHGGAPLPATAIFSDDDLRLHIVVGDSPGDIASGLPGFIGEVDDLRVTSGDGSATKAYFAFDEAHGDEAKDASGLGSESTSGMSTAASLQLGGVVKWVLSTAPAAFTRDVTLAEDGAAVIELDGADADGDVVHVIVTRPPLAAHGFLAFVLAPTDGGAWDSASPKTMHQSNAIMTLYQSRNHTCTTITLRVVSVLGSRKYCTPH